MPLVRSGLRGDVDHAASKPSVFRGKVAALNFEFLSGVNRRNGGDLIEEAGGAGNAVDQDFVGLIRPAINRKIAVECGVDRDVPKLSAGRRRAQHAWCQLHQPEGAAAVERNVFYGAIH